MKLIQIYETFVSVFYEKTINSICIAAKFIRLQQSHYYTTIKIAPYDIGIWNRTVKETDNSHLVSIYELRPTNWTYFYETE